MASPSEEPALVTFTGVGYRYRAGDELALDAVELAIPRGQIVGVVGASGAGKSTLCRLLNGIVPQFHGGELFGAVRVAGLDTLDTATALLARRVGMVFEDPESQITAPSVELEIAFALENFAVPSAEIRARVDAAIEASGLSGLAERHPANLSGGQKQRLAIASAVALRPDLIVLDEPTSQLDPVGAQDVFDLLARLNVREGITIVVASHATEELAEVAGRIVLLDGGRVAADGAPDAVLGDVEGLGRRRVRPPDIARCFALLQGQGSLAPGRRPVTLADASREGLRVLDPLAAPFSGERTSVPYRDGTAFDSAGNRETVVTSEESAAAPTVALQAIGLEHVYPDGTRALDGLDLSIRSGEFVALCGHNGSGKSTLVKHFLHLLEASAGRVEVEGRDATGMNVAALARLVGYVAQNAHQHLFADSVGEEVAFAPRLLGADDVEARRVAERALETMRLGWAIDRHPMTLSRGDRLRVAIAAVLGLEPRTLVFDEPTTGQDWAGAKAVLDILRTLNAQGHTVVVITHHLYLLPGFAERLVVLDGGRVVLDGPLRAMFYERDALRASELVAPQAVRFAAGFPEIARGEHRPVSPAELAALFAVREAGVREFAS